MAYLRYLGDTAVHKVEAIPYGNVLDLKFEGNKVISTAGVDLFLDEECNVDIGGGFYHGFTTIYRNDKVTEEYNGYQLSDDGSVYIEPEPPKELTLEEVKGAKRMEILSMAESEIAEGIEMNGIKFPYKQKDRADLRATYETASITGNSGFAQEVDGKMVELSASEISSLYLSQERNKAEIEAYSTQLLKMIGDSSDKEEASKISYGEELQGDYLDRYNESMYKEERFIARGAEMSIAMGTQSKIMAVNNTDEQALSVKGLYADWENDKDGYDYKMERPEDRRRNDQGKLWSLQKDHAKQVNYRPGNDPTLWREIVEGHSGAENDPIPVPDSVTVSGFEYEYGKYYVENEVVYLCKRGGVENPEEMYGQKETLFFMPSQLIGQYFVVA